MGARQDVEVAVRVEVRGDDASRSIEVAHHLDVLEDEVVFLFTESRSGVAEPRHGVGVLERAQHVHVRVSIQVDRAERDGRYNE